LIIDFHKELSMASRQTLEAQASMLKQSLQSVFPVPEDRRFADLLRALDDAPDPKISRRD